MMLYRPEPEDPIPGMFYDREYFANMSSRNRHIFRESRGQRLTDDRIYYIGLLELEPGMRLVDLGCGTGEMIMYCAQVLGAECWGVDYSDAAIDIAEELCELISVEAQQRVHFIRGDCTDLPWAEDGFFDRALSVSSIEHLYDWQIERMLDEVWRVLRSGGQLVVETHPNRNAEHIAWPIARQILGQDVEMPHKGHGGHVNVQSPDSLGRHLRQAGFRNKVWMQPGTGLVKQSTWVRAVGMILTHTWPFNIWFANQIMAVGRKPERLD